MRSGTLHTICQPRDNFTIGIDKFDRDITFLWERIRNAQHAFCTDKRRRIKLECEIGKWKCTRFPDRRCRCVRGGSDAFWCYSCFPRIRFIDNDHRKDVFFCHENVTHVLSRSRVAYQPDAIECRGWQFQRSERINFICCRVTMRSRMKNVRVYRSPLRAQRQWALELDIVRRIHCGIIRSIAILANADQTIPRERAIAI